MILSKKMVFFSLPFIFLSAFILTWPSFYIIFHHYKKTNTNTSSGMLKFYEKYNDYVIRANHFDNTAKDEFKELNNLLKNFSNNHFVEIFPHNIFYILSEKYNRVEIDYNIKKKLPGLKNDILEIENYIEQNSVKLSYYLNDKYNYVCLNDKDSSCDRILIDSYFKFLMVKHFYYFKQRNESKISKTLNEIHSLFKVSFPYMHSLLGKAQIQFIRKTWINYLFYIVQNFENISQYKEIANEFEKLIPNDSIIEAIELEGLKFDFSRKQTFSGLENIISTLHIQGELNILDHFFYTYMKSTGVLYYMYNYNKLSEDNFLIISDYLSQIREFEKKPTESFIYKDNIDPTIFVSEDIFSIKNSFNILFFSERPNFDYYISKFSKVKKEGQTILEMINSHKKTGT